jgi:hypothetical protein
MNSVITLALVPIVLLAGCGTKPAAEESPGAAARYLDNVVAHEDPADRAATAKGADERSPASGAPDASLGQAPVFSREAVAPR